MTVENVENKATIITKPKLLQRGAFGSLYEMQLQPSQPQQQSTSQATTVTEYEGLLELPKCNALDQDSSLQQQQRLLCLHRYKIWWMRPVFVPLAFSNVPPETMFLLYKSTSTATHDDDKDKYTKEAYQLVLPLVLPIQRHSSTATTSAVASSSLRGCRSTDEGFEQDAAVMVTSHYPQAVIYVGSHASDSYALIQEAVEMSSSLLFKTTTVSIDDEIQRHEEDNDNSNSQSSTGSSVFADHLGWCTWNALYTQLSGRSIVQAVEQITQDGKIPVRWMIIDDGWQDVTGKDDDVDGMQWAQRLKGVKEHPTKFAEMSLKECISILHGQYHIQDVWCWHTLMGYWLGVLPPASKNHPHDFTGDIPSSTLYLPMFSSGLRQNDHSIPLEASITQGIGIPDDPYQFWNAYHGYLHDCGVTGVKIDAQAVVASIMSSATDNSDAIGDREDDASQHLDSHSNVEKSMILKLRNAVTESVRNNFGDPNSHMLNCMAHAPEIFYLLTRQSPLPPDGIHGHQQQDNKPSFATKSIQHHNKPFLRAADDFYPHNPYSHGPHLVACAYNSLLLSQVARLDWDMFTTQLEPKDWVRVHAVSRCFSGGPLYVSDAPNHIDKSVIDWIACEDGTTLPCREAARPIADCLFHDPLAIGSPPLVIFNTNGDPTVTTPDATTSGVMGIFHVAGSGQWDYENLEYSSSSKDVSAGLEEARTMRVSPNQIPHFAQSRFAATEFAAIQFFSRKADILASPSSSIEVTMEPLQSEALTFIPVSKVKGGDVASLGFLGTMINGAGAVLRQELDEASRLVCHVRGCGLFWWAVRLSPKLPFDFGRSDMWSQLLDVHMDGIEHEIQVATDNQYDSIPGGLDLIKKGFVLVSLEVQASATKERIVVFDLTIPAPTAPNA
jgi:hypothetical protein